MCIEYLILKRIHIHNAKTNSFLWWIVVEYKYHQIFEYFSNKLFKETLFHFLIMKAILNFKQNGNQLNQSRQISLICENHLKLLIYIYTFIWHWTTASNVSQTKVGKQ